jgi:ankyrin repeat protein
MSKRLPARPSLEYLKNEAKGLLRAFRRGDSAVLRQIRSYHPRRRDLNDETIAAGEFGLQDAQLVVARQYSFESWPQLVAELELTPLKRALEEAILCGDGAAVEKLISAHPDLLNVNVRSRNSGLPLSFAANAGQLEVVKVLLRFAPSDLEHAFNRANLQGYLDISRYFLAERPELGADLKFSLFGPCEALKAEAIPFLAELGADPNAVWENGGTPLDMAICTYSQTGRSACIEALVQAGVRYEDGPEMDLHRGRLDRLQERLAADADLLHRPSTFRRGLEYGGLYGGAPLVRSTLLHIAAEFGELEAAEMLLVAGADSNARCVPDAEGIGDQTPIFHVASSRHPQALAMLSLLAERGADLNARAAIRVPQNGLQGVQPQDPVLRDITPLAYALNYPNGDEPRAEIVEALRERGAIE